MRIHELIEFFPTEVKARVPEDTKYAKFGLIGCKKCERWFFHKIDLEGHGEWHRRAY